MITIIVLQISQDPEMPRKGFTTPPPLIKYETIVPNIKDENWIFDQLKEKSMKKPFLFRRAPPKQILYFHRFFLIDFLLYLEN